MLIPIIPGVAFDTRELQETFIRSSGPGGQNVNKVSSAVQVRLDLRASALPAPLRSRAERLGGGRVTVDGVLVITAQRHRSQDQNRQDAVERVVALLRAAAIRPETRIPTKPGMAARRRRTDAKTHRGSIKRLRTTPGED